MADEGDTPGDFTQEDWEEFLEQLLNLPTVLFGDASITRYRPIPPEPEV